MLTVLLIFLPLVAALLVLALKPAVAQRMAIIFTVVEWVISVYVSTQFVTSDAIQFSVNVPWIPSLGVHFYVGMDGISLLLVLLTTTLTPLILLSTLSGPSRPASFYALILTMQMALVGVFCAYDGLLFYLFWEMALIPIYFICLIWGGENRGKITLKFFIYTLAGSLLMLVGLVYLYLHTPGTHTFEIQAIYEAGRSLPQEAQVLIFWAMFLAFAIKMPVFPFHTWQPDTYAVAPVQGTMLLSGIMLKMGIYGVIRWLIPVVPIGVEEWGLTAVILSVIGVIYGSCIAIIQKDLKRLIAYSSIAHVGLISAGLFTQSTIGIQGTMIQMLSHGIVVVGLFFIIDVIELRTKTRDLSHLGGLRNVAPMLTTVFVIVLLGSVALPFTSGFVGEFLLINALFQYSHWIGAVAGLTIILSAVYMLTAFQKAMSGEMIDSISGFPDLTTNEKMVLLPICILIIVIGIFPGPLMDLSEPAVASLVKSLADLTASAK